MYLHNDREAFEQLIAATSTKLSIEPTIVEKDYFVTITLGELNKKNENFVFKGGTSLSKCFGIIKRFSEDIDISFDQAAGVLTEGKKEISKIRLLTLWKK